MNEFFPKITHPTDLLKAKDDCEHIEFCRKLDIITDDCLIGANSVRRCRQGEYAQIRLLATILKRLDSRL